MIKKKEKMKKRGITQTKVYLLIVNLVLAIVAFSWIVKKKINYWRSIK